MAANFWLSTHRERWMFTLQELQRIRHSNVLRALQAQSAGASASASTPEGGDAAEPSAEDVASRERALRHVFVRVLHACGNALGFPQVVSSTAAMFLQRYFLKKSMLERDPRTMVAACLFLAAKVEEYAQYNPNDFSKKLNASLKKTEFVYPLAFNEKHTSNLLGQELELLSVLKFDLVIYHPAGEIERFVEDFHRESVRLSNTGGGPASASIVSSSKSPSSARSSFSKSELESKISYLLNTAQSIAIDAQRGDVCLCFPPYVVALATVYIAGLREGLDTTGWLAELNDVDLNLIRACADVIINEFAAWIPSDLKEVPACAWLVELHRPPVVAS